jgi:hypothetical protein
MVKKQYRQGDVLVTPIDSIPNDAKPVKTVNGQHILAYGEATGHMHSVREEMAEFLGVGERRFLKVKEPTQMVHAEHSALVLEPGTYEVKIQEEVWLNEVRRVAD